MHLHIHVMPSRNFNSKVLYKNTCHEIKHFQKIYIHLYIFTMDGTENTRGGSGYFPKQHKNNICGTCCHVPEGSKSIVSSYGRYIIITALVVVSLSLSCCFDLFFCLVLFFFSCCKTLCCTFTTTGANYGRY